MNIDRIFLNENFQTKDEVFHFLAKEMASLKIVDDSKKYLEALRQREEQSSTGLVDGFAIPHGKSDSIKKAAIIYIRNCSGIEWDSLDGSLVTDIFALAIPQNDDNVHLDSLIYLSTKLMDPDICQRLRLATDKEDIIKIFE